MGPTDLPTDETMEAEFQRLARGGKPPERLDVVQGGAIVGTVPGSFSPSAPLGRDERGRPKGSVMYGVRPGDYRIEGEQIVADAMLGMGDLMLIPGFSPMLPARGPIPLEDVRKALDLPDYSEETNP